MNPERNLPVVIVGGGFAGATLAQHLEKQLDPGTPIVVISRDNHLVFTPMLAEVAARTVSPFHVVVAGRQMTKRTRWIAAAVTGLDFDKNLIYYDLSRGDQASLEFAHLVLACGLDVNLGEVPGLAAHALPLKSIEDAFTLGNALIGKFEEASIETDRDRQVKLLTTVVIGGGFSGVEIAGHLHDLAKSIRPYYRFSDGVEPQTLILHRGERVIPELQHEALSAYAVEKLRKNGIQVLLKTGVREISKTEVHLADGRRLSYGLLAGTVGNTASKFLRESGLPLERNRLKTNGAMRMEERENIWALGDCAVIPNAFDGKPSPPTAQFALRQAKQLAANMRRTYEKKPLSSFYFRPQGLLASIGQRNGVAEVYGIKFSGIVAWFFWRAVYLMKMPSFSRKAGIAIDWLMNALFPENLVRLSEPASVLRREHYVTGDVVYRQGQPARTLYMIEAGTASATVEGEGEPVAHILPGEYFGLSALEERETTRGTTVKAEETLDVLAFDRPRSQDLSRNMLTREMLSLLEKRHLRESLYTVIDKFPDVGGLKLHDAMVKDPKLLNERETLRDAMRKLSVSPLLPVVSSEGKLTGICDRDTINAALSKGWTLNSPVSEFASEPSFALKPDRSLRHATADYLRSGLDLVPVVDDDFRLLGVFGLIEAAQLLSERHMQTGAAGGS